MELSLSLLLSGNLGCGSRGLCALVGTIDSAWMHFGVAAGAACALLALLVILPCAGSRRTGCAAFACVMSATVLLVPFGATGRSLLLGMLLGVGTIAAGAPMVGSFFAAAHLVSRHRSSGCRLLVYVLAGSATGLLVHVTDLVGTSTRIVRCSRYMDVAMHSECPDESIADALAPLLATRGGPPTMQSQQWLPHLLTRRARSRLAGARHHNVSRLMPTRDEHCALVFVNVGANKGFVVNTFLQRWHTGWLVTSQQ